MYKKIISLIISVLMLSTFIPSNIIKADNMKDLSSFDNMINEIFDNRMEAILNKNEKEVLKAEEKLEKIGVKKMNNEEIKNFLYKKDFSTYAEIPNVNTIDFWSVRVNSDYHGQSFEVQTIIAQPKSTTYSSLYSAYPYDIKINDAVAVTSAIIPIAIKTIVGELPLIGKAVTFYDVLKDINSLITPTSSIKNPEYSIQVFQSTSISFKYVKKVGEPDTKQNLSFRSSKTAATVTYTIPNLDTNVSIVPNPIQGRYSLYGEAKNYNSTESALLSYLYTEYPDSDFVHSIDIFAPNGYYISSLNIIRPEFPYQLF